MSKQSRRGIEKSGFDTKLTFSPRVFVSQQRGRRREGGSRRAQEGVRPDASRVRVDFLPDPRGRLPRLRARLRRAAGGRVPHPRVQVLGVDDGAHHLHVLPVRRARDEAHRRLPQGVLEELRHPLRVHLRWHGDDQLRALVPQLRDAHRVQVGEDRARDGLLRAHRRKKYNWKEWLSAAILVAGIVLFTLGDVASSPRSSPSASRSPARSASAICAFEEKNFFRCENPSTTRRCSASPRSSAPSTA